jgi:hypothetical protein
MKIYRGPSTKPLEDLTHELVSDIDVEKSGSFVDNSVVLIANITKEPEERQAVAHLKINESDLLALHRRMFTGLASKAKDLELLESRVASASQELYALFESLAGADESWELEDRIAVLESQLAEARDVVGKVAYELDKRQAKQHG